MKNIIEKAKSLDQADPLASFRSKFHFPEKNGVPCIYLCGNSLGLQPVTTRQAVNDELNHWQEHGVEGHITGNRPWVSYHEYSKNALAKIVGAKQSEVVAMNNLTTNLHLAMASFYRPKGKRTKILIEKGAFPSDYYAVHSSILQNGGNPTQDLIQLETQENESWISTEKIIETIERLGDELAMVMLPGVQYYTGQFFEIKEITKAAHATGANCGFDLAHAVGNVPLNLHDDKVDFAVWCTYKYLNSGPGAVGGLFIHERQASNKDIPRLSGWWGHNPDVRFKMNNDIDPIPSVDGWQLSNVNVLSHAAHLASLDLFEEAGMKNLREKSLKLTGFLEELIVQSEILAGHIEILTPSDPNARGAQLSLFLTNHGKSIFDRLISKNVIMDWREPNVIRVAPVPMYNSFSDVSNFVELLEVAIRDEEQ
ncbi:MAG: kynureninase [Ekhidna sp.]|nr:kynureninase [Ekhidna sp.]